jgi:hypothetical protein
MYDDKDAYDAMVHDPKTDENFGKIWSCSRPSRRGPMGSGSYPARERVRSATRTATRGLG